VAAEPRNVPEEEMDPASTVPVPCWSPDKASFAVLDEDWAGGAIPGEVARERAPDQMRKGLVAEAEG